MRRIHKGLVVAVSTVAFAAAGCTSQTVSQTRHRPRRPGARRALSLSARPWTSKGWDPTKQPGYQSWAHEAVWDTLVKCDANGKATPDVADTFEVTDNNTHVQGAHPGGPEVQRRHAGRFGRREGVVRVRREERPASTADYKGIKIDTPDAQNICITWPEPQGRSWTTRSAAPRSLRRRG